MLSFYNRIVPHCCRSGCGSTKRGDRDSAADPLPHVADERRWPEVLIETALAKAAIRKLDHKSRLDTSVSAINQLIWTHGVRDCFSPHSLTRPDRTNCVRVQLVGPPH